MAITTTVNIDTKGAIDSINRLQSTIKETGRTTQEMSQRTSAAFEKTEMSAKDAAVAVKSVETGIKQLERQASAAKTPAEFDKIKRKIKEAKFELKNMRAASKKTSKEMKKNAKSASASYAKLAGVIGAAFGIRAIARFFSASLENYKKQEMAVQSLTTALGKQSKALEKQAADLQGLSFFGDEEIIQGQAFLAQLGLTEKQIKALTPSIVDFAAAKGMDLKTASDLVAKSVGSETNALSRYGITIEGAAGSTERMESAVNALNGAYGGQAEALAEVDGGMEQFKNSIGDTTENMGEMIALVLGEFIPALTEMNNLANSMVSNFSDLKKEYGLTNKEAVRASSFMEALNRGLDASGDKLLESVELQGMLFTEASLFADIGAKDVGTYKKIFQDWIASMKVSDESTRNLTKSTKALKEETRDYVAELEEALKLQKEWENFGQLSTDTIQIKPSEIELDTSGLRTQLEIPEDAYTGSLDGIVFWWDENKDAVQTVFDEFAEMYDGLLQNQIENAERRTALLNQQITENQKAILIEQNDRVQGYASNVQSAKQRDEELKALRAKSLADEERTRKAQWALDTITQGSNLITAVSGAYEQAGGNPILGTLLAGLVIAGFAASRAAALKETSTPKFEKGGHGLLGGQRHSQGGTYLPGIGEAEKGEYFGIVNRKMTRKYQNVLPEIFDSLNNGSFEKNINYDDQWTKRSAEYLKTIAERDSYNQGKYTIIKRGMIKTRIKK